MKVDTQCGMPSDHINATHSPCKPSPTGVGSNTKKIAAHMQGRRCYPSIRPALQPKHNAHEPAALVRLLAHPAVVREGCGLADGQFGVAHKKVDVDA